MKSPATGGMLGFEGSRRVLQGLRWDVHTWQSCSPSWLARSSPWGCRCRWTPCHRAPAAPSESALASRPRLESVWIFGRRWKSTNPSLRHSHYRESFLCFTLKCWSRVDFLTSLRLFLPAALFYVCSSLRWASAPAAVAPGGSFLA